MQSAGLSHLVPILASADDPWSIDRMLEKTRIVVCSEQAAERIRERVPHDVEVILADRRLDTGGHRTAAGPAGPARGGAGMTARAPAATSGSSLRRADPAEPEAVA